MPIAQLTTPTLKATSQRDAFEALSGGSNLIDEAFGKSHAGLDALNQKINIDPNKEAEDSNTSAIIQALSSSKDKDQLASILDDADSQGVHYDKAKALEFLNNRDNTLYTREENITKHNLDIDKLNQQAKNNFSIEQSRLDQQAYIQGSRNQQSAMRENARYADAFNQRNREIPIVDPATGDVLRVLASQRNSVEKELKFGRDLNSAKNKVYEFQKLNGIKIQILKELHLIKMVHLKKD